MSEETHNNAVLERLDVITEEIRSGFAAIDKRMNAFQERLEQIEIQNDRTSATAYATRSEFIEMRREMKEFLKWLKEPV